MKKIILISSLVLASAFLLAGFITNSNQKSAVNTRTEEYAIVDVLEQGKKKIIRVTIGEEPAIEREWEKQKTDLYGDYTPVMKELHALNEKGFEIVNSSLAFTPAPVSNGNSFGSGYPRSTFLLRKKIQ
ncbi:hypothetical protein [Cytophaga aurantiaca]|uniref:hypothetical protein n=1 Tax=Cytophaga aurantiaca TaxID=29530 RepID=UPI0003622896|nr:hypothetical protein [Cytophaga aurantiaca]